MCLGVPTGEGAPQGLRGWGSSINGVWGRVPQWVWATPKVFKSKEMASMLLEHLSLIFLFLGVWGKRAAFPQQAVCATIVASKHRACQTFCILDISGMEEIPNISRILSHREMKGGTSMDENENKVASLSSRKEATRKEPKQISFRVSELDYERLKLSAEVLNMSVTKFAKMKAEGSRIVRPKFDGETVKDLVHEMRKIGVNVNQIAKWCNTHQNVSASELERLNHNLEKIKKEMNELWRQLS
jgi:Bacterial mobilisation protein (MobC)